LAVEIDTLGSSYREHFKLFVIAGSLFFQLPGLRGNTIMGRGTG